MTRLKSKESSAITYAFTANILYFVLCIIINTIDTQDQSINILFLSLSVLLWFIMGNAFSRNLYKKDYKKCLAFIVLSFVPILIFFIIYNILAFISVNGATNNWMLFYSVGAPVLFFTKPAVFLLNFIDIEFYLFAYLFVAILAFFVFLGAVSNRKNIRVSSSKTDTAKNEHIDIGDKKSSASEQAAFSTDSMTNKQKLKSYEVLYEEIVASDIDDGYVQVTFDNFNNTQDIPSDNNTSDETVKNEITAKDEDDKKDTEN